MAEHDCRGCISEPGPSVTTRVTSLVGNISPALRLGPASSVRVVQEQLSTWVRRLQWISGQPDQYQHRGLPLFYGPLGYNNLRCELFL